MEIVAHVDLPEIASAEITPSLIRLVESNGISGFDKVQGTDTQVGAAAEAAAARGSIGTDSMACSVSISLALSPAEVHFVNNKSIPLEGVSYLMAGSCNTDGNDAAIDADNPRASKQIMFHSQPMPGMSQKNNILPKDPKARTMKDKRFDSFKTWSGKLEKQLPNIRGSSQGADARTEDHSPRNAEIETLPVDRYFAALEGPELDTLRGSEETVLPSDEKWPFLLRYPISSFGICLGMSSQAILWKTLSMSESMKFLNVCLGVNLYLWFISVALVGIVSLVYLLKVLFYFEAVRREYYHPIRINFFFAPWIALLFLALGVPLSIASDLPKYVWYVLMTPLFVLELKIYGQWMSGGQRRLSKVANPSNHLSIVGNFVGALLGASMGIREGPLFFFAIGLAHYMVLFVTLYQRLPTNETLPKDLHPVFFLFVAAPSVASMAWAKIQGTFDNGSRIAFFVALFLYFSLVVRLNFFRGFRFSLAWWAYTFPMTGAAIATVRYSNEVTNVVTQGLAAILSTVAVLTVTSLLVTTIIHAFVLRDLFPNDMAIAITERKSKANRKWRHSRHGSSDAKGIEKYLKFADAQGKDIESGLEQPDAAAKDCKEEEEQQP
ncbi:hypothetical protein MLD38_025697 [Melastoma candidum]|uniref:Uncharacterized protein n=1 Tax=Melastoma candidum TaxID=119954 RepID=A0ACB9NVX3_9MYRT|nr:hypothetical protein MLD38_025697 [Melastoma candidum]